MFLAEIMLEWHILWKSQLNDNLIAAGRKNPLTHPIKRHTLGQHLRFLHAPYHSESRADIGDMNHELATWADVQHARQPTGPGCQNPIG